MKKQLIFFLFSLVLVVSLQNCKYAKIDSIVNNSSEAGFTTINAKGRIIDYKDDTPTAHGHCYSTTVEIPEIGLADTKIKETPYQNVDFESKIDSLLFDKEYFVRPYMRNGDKIVYGEVQKITTKTPAIIIKNFVVKDSLTSPMTSDSLISIDILTNEPSIVLPFSTNVTGREYGFVFGKADSLNITNINITNGFLTSGTVFRISFPSPPTYVIPPANNNRRNLSLSLKRSSPTPPNSSTGVMFFDSIAGTNYFVRAYLKLNRDGIAKYYYSERIKFRIK